MNAPAGPGLASVQRLYYLAVERGRFDSLAALCAHLGKPVSELQAAIDVAQIDGGPPAVVLDRVGPQSKEPCQVVILEPDGALVLCLAMFSHMEFDEAPAEEMLAELRSQPESRGSRFMFLEFRADVTRMLQ